MKIQRILNQNRISVIVSILIAVFIVVVIQIVNAMYANKEKQEKEAKAANTTNTTTTQDIPYKNESETVISDTKVAKDSGIVYGNIIEGFLNYCVNGKVEEAYNLLSQDCKDMYYKTLKDFKDTYYKDKFSEKRSYKFQSWISGPKTIYQIQLYEDMLSTGKATSKYILDYYTIVVEDNQFKLNINNFIDKEEINTTYKYEDVTITINNVEINKENSIYNLTVKNDSENTIKLDGRESTKTVYITDKNGTKFKSMLYELLDEDLIIKPGEEKNIKIKFNIVYRDDLELKNIIFNDVIMDYDEYTKNKENVKKHKIVLGI